MLRLSALDASFLSLDGGNSVGHVCLVAVLQGDLDLARLRDVVRSRIDLVPLLRHRLHTPLGVGRPYWVEDPAFDLDRHLFERRLHPPAGPRQLAREVERIAVPVLDRSLPLWQIHLLRGLPDGGSALVTKIHHAAVDGIAGRELLTALLDAERNKHVAVSGEHDVAHVPAALQAVGRGLGHVLALPVRVVRLEARVLRKVPDLSALALASATRVSGRSIEWLSGGDPDDDGSLASSPHVLAPPTPFNRAISTDRAWAFGRLPLDPTRRVRRKLDASVNDVLLAATAGALRRWLQKRNALPGEPLRAMVPVSVRTSEELSELGNRIGVMLCSLPTNEPDPLERLRVVRESTVVAKQHRAIAAKRLQEITQLAVPSLTTRALAVAARVRLADWVRLPMNLVVSNVPGQREPVRLAGHVLQALYPVPPIGDGLGLNITVQGYRDQLHVGVTVSPELVPDVWVLLGYLEDAYDELVRLGNAE